MPETPRKVGFVSLGCPKNLVDSEVMIGTLAGHGYTITHDRTEADVIVVNTCSFIDSAKKESIDTILEMAQLKTDGNCKRLVVSGCLAERYRNEIQRDIPEVDFVFGPDELGQILAAVDDNGNGSVVNIDSLYTSREIPTIPRVLSTPSHMAYMKISEGCDHVCAFCAIPGFRGKFRSRAPGDLVREAHDLVSRGVREIVIVSQDTLAYGKDLGMTDGITTLLEQLAAVPGLPWLRFLYCYPHSLTDALIRLVAETPSICNYFDIPYQHASRPVLDRMRRGGSRSIYERQIERIRRVIPDAGVRTSFIVGHPGETEPDFEELMTFVRNVGFDNVGVFLYSDEEGTAAFNLDGKVPRRTAVRRRNALMKAQSKISASRLRARVGGTVTVLFEGVSEESELLLKGRMETQAPDIDGCVLINDTGDLVPNRGDFYRVEITDSHDYDLVGRIASRAV